METKFELQPLGYDEMREHHFIPVSERAHIEWSYQGLVRIWSLSQLVSFERFQADEVDALIDALKTVRQEQIEAQKHREVPF